MAAQEESEEADKRQVLDTPGLKKLIAKVKRGDKENADAIAVETAAREAAVLRIAPPESAGTGEVIFYRGELI